MSPNVLTLPEAAAYLRLSERKLYALVAEHRVPVARVDGRLLFPRRLVDAWLGERVEAAPRRPPPPVLAGSHDPLLEWAVRESGCGLAQLTTDRRRTDAHRFYASLGFEPSHVGFKITL